jgi:cell wall-associated NlpC family hydrolase
MTVSFSSLFRPATRLLVVLTLVLGLFGGVAVKDATQAQAAVSTGVSAAVATKALGYAASKKGAPYLWGAVGPSRFDCSGLTKWAYARAGRTLPRTVAQQYAATIRVSKAKARLGDLVFFMSGGVGYHMGVYAGAGKIWHSPKTGDRVKLSTIWTTAVAYGRVR